MVTYLQPQHAADRKSRKFEASLVYMVRSKLAGAMKLGCVKKPRNKRRRKGREGREGGEKDICFISLESELPSFQSLPVELPHDRGERAREAEGASLPCMFNPLQWVQYGFPGMFRP